jgi:two-component system KDP operon response regulator KdpE
MDRVIVVGSDGNVRRQLGDGLRTQGHDVVECDTGEAAIAWLQEAADALIISSAGEPDSARKLLAQALAVDAELSVIVLASTTEEAIEALRAGAFYAARSPLNSEEILLLTRRAIEARAAKAKRAEYRLPPQGIDFRELERDVVVQALRLAHGNQTRAATLLGMTRDQIRYRMAKFGMNADRVGVHAA